MVIGARPLNDAVARLQYSVAPVTRREFSRALKGLLATQWWPEDRLRELQEQRLRALLMHSWLNVPFYRAQIDAAGLNPRTATLDQLRSLPILEKATIQAEGTNLLSHGAIAGEVGVFENHSGGSTGVALTFYQDRAYYRESVAERQRDWSLCGYRSGDRVAFLWGSAPDSRDHTSAKGRLKDYVQNHVWINTFDVTVDDLRAAHRRFLSFKPALLVGYVGSLTRYANLIHEDGLTPLKPKAIQTCSEVLSAHERGLLEDAFGCQIYDRYACREAGSLAQECEAHAGLHIIAESNLVEIIRESGEPAAVGETGYVLVTNLLNRAMPLIRYRLGDLAVLRGGACSCGRGLPMLDHVQGRTADVITAPNGKLLDRRFFTQLIWSIPGVRQFRIEQMDRRRLVLEVVPGTGFRRGSLDSVVDAIHEQGDRDFIVESVMRDTIPPSKSGKFQYTTSRIVPVLPEGSSLEREDSTSRGGG